MGPPDAIPARRPAPMSDGEFAQLAKIIEERSGIHFPAGKKYALESRLSRRLAELAIDSYGQYIALLSTGPYQADEFQEMFNRITINESSFFRNQPQLEAFEKQILPVALEARAAGKRLRIWSAGCASGEEPFTLAILLHRTLGVRLADWRIEILGTDISEKALETARKAEYTGHALRSTPEAVRKRYFRQQGELFALDPTVRSMVRFEMMNLKDRQAARKLPAWGSWDFIFCRNAMIYFDDAMKRACVEMFAGALADDGCLLVGHSESLRGAEGAMEPWPIPQAFCYRKARGA